MKRLLFALLFLASNLFASGLSYWSPGTIGFPPASAGRNIGTQANLVDCNHTFVPYSTDTGGVSIFGEVSFYATPPSGGTNIIDLCLYDDNQDRIWSLGGFTVTGTANVSVEHHIDFTPITLSGNYWACWTANNTSVKIATNNMFHIALFYEGISVAINRASAGVCPATMGGIESYPGSYNLVGSTSQFFPLMIFTP